MSKYFELTEEGKSKVDKLPTALRYIVKYLMSSADDLINGNCSEEEIISSVTAVKNSKESRISDADVMNYDEAGKMLGFGTTNRVGLKALLDKNNIHQVYINNMACGFRRCEITALRDKLDKDIRKRIIKRKRRLS